MDSDGGRTKDERYNDGAAVLTKKHISLSGSKSPASPHISIIIILYFLYNSLSLCTRKELCYLSNR